MARVLIVEDSDVTREVYAGVLRNQGHDVQTAVNGVEARQIVDDEDFDVILTDIKMPEMDGLEVIQLMSEAANHAKIIAVISANSADESFLLKAAEILGADHVLAKPVSPADLSALVSGSGRV